MNIGPSRNAWIEIDLKAIRHNIHEIQRFIGSKTEIMAVVKANAYGHGLIEVAQQSINAGAQTLGVAIINEAISLREEGIDAPILVFGCALPTDVTRIIRYNLSHVVSNREIINALSKEATKQQKKAKIHIKVDTGMGRIGISYKNALTFIKKVSHYPNIELEGLMTQFSTADTPDDLSYTHKQLERFLTIINELEKKKIEIRWRHAASSAGITFVPESHLDLVRPGLILYGIPPTDSPCSMRLHPALTLKAKLTQMRFIDSGESVGYGRSFVTKRKSKLGLIPLGYGDGYSRKHSNKGKIIVNGEYVPVVGRICMDQFLVDLTDCNKVELGDEVILIGKQGELEISVWDVAKSMDSIPNEVVSPLSTRLPRLFNSV